MSEYPERAILDYVSRVGEEAYGRIPSRRRAAFLGEVREHLGAACAAAGASTEAEVDAVLDRFGAPGEIVDREVGADPADPADGADQDGGADAGGPGGARGSGPRRFRTREAPPWRGGPETGWFGRRAGAAGGISVGPARTEPIAGPRPPAGGAVRAITSLTALFAHPAEAAALLLYLLGAVFGGAVYFWPVAAALVVLSRMWPRTDKWVLVLGPIAATLIGMAVWPGDAPYVDQAVLGALADTGIIGARIALGACTAYMLARFGRAADLRAAAAAGEAGGDGPGTGVMDR